MEDNSLTNAIDTHNIANGDDSWFEKKINNIGGILEGTGEALTKGAVGAVVAGVDSILNTGIAVANFVGADMEPINTYRVMKSLDDDFGEYYKQHQVAIETAGFIGTSFIPGLAGVKAIQAAKAGIIGSNMAKSTGLMTSLTYDYAKAARIEFASGNSPFSILNANTVKALAQGLGSSALDMAAFETAVTATMYKSPMLSEQDASDIFWNIATGTAIGGGIGALIHGTQLGYGIIKAGKAVDIETFPYRYIETPPETATPDVKLINLYSQKFNMPEPELYSGTTKSDIDPASRLQLIIQARDKTLERLDVMIQQELTNLAGGDARVSKQLFDVLDSSRSLQDVTGALMFTRGASRITQAESLEYGDVIFPQHKMPLDKFNEILKTGKTSDLFVSSATKETQGFRVVGDISNIKVAAYSREILNKETAFAKNYDVYRNPNGSFSVNPESKILESSEFRRLRNNLVVDFDQNGAIVEKATPGIADFASKESPILVKGNTVLAGSLDPIKLGDTLKFNPVVGSHVDVQARYIWAQEQKNIFWKDKIIGENDLPLLEKAYYDGDKSTGFLIKRGDTVSLAPTGERLSQFIESKKYELAQRLNGTPIDEIGYRLNVSDKWLRGEKDDIAKLRPGVDYQNPRYAKVDYPEGSNAQELYNTMQLDGAIHYEIQKGLIELRHQQNFANFAGSFTSEFPARPNWSDPGRTPTREGAGATLLGFANGNYGTAPGWAQVTGIATHKLEIAKQTAFAEKANPLMASIVQDGQDAITELALVENTLRSSPKAWVAHPDGSQTIIPRDEYGLVLKGGQASESLDIKNSNVWDFNTMRADHTAGNQIHIKNLKGAAGVVGDDSDPRVWYPIPLDTTRYKHFVFVEPREIALADKKRMIVAKDEATLNKLVSMVDQNKFNVVTKVDAEDWHKAINDYNFSLGINESSVDSALKRKGVMGEFFPNVTADRVMQDIMDWHIKQETILTKRMVEHNYSQAFQELELLGKDYTNLATSQFRSLTQKLESGVKDPYNEIVKTALDISTGTESRYQWWRGFNDTIKDAIEVPVNKMREIFRNTEQLTDEDFQQIRNISDRMGMGRPFETAYQANVAAGNIADKPWLAKGVAEAQGIMSSTLLQLDSFNAVNNAVSAPIITSAEFSNLVKGIMSGDAQVAGKLSELMSVKMPDGSGITMPSFGKLMKNALENYRIDGSGDGALLKRYQSIGAVTDILQQERQMLNELTFTWKESPSQVNTAIKNATNFGRKWTGNQLAEEMTRFMAADVMRQVTDLAIESGVLKDIGEANEYIQLFVNRTQGNYLHSQRPIVFQGVVGQAVSLFQTYQFNLMQQMFRYVGEGDSKSIATLLGLQGSIYGMQGLPAFNFLNTHIVGNASGNTEHKDLYQASYTVFGKQLGDWLLYGAGSNALGLVDPSMKINLYSRGDINPRQLTVLPTTLSDIPVVNASVKFVTNLYRVSQKIASDGSVWPALSQGLEHNGLSRPLAGLAQVVQGYTTTSEGSLLSLSQDFGSIATLSRVAGGKPFDEAVALDQIYRINAYKAKDTSNLQTLGSAIKSTMIGGGTPSQEQVDSFAKEYAKSGGRIENFNKFFTNSMMNANQSQVNRLAQHIQSPYSKQLQIIMGGTPLPDYFNQPVTPK